MSYIGYESERNMVYLLRSGEWYRVGYSESRFVLDPDENPSMELLGQQPGGISDADRWSRRMSSVADDLRGDWRLLRDAEFVEGMLSEFSIGGGSVRSGGIGSVYDAESGGSASRIVKLYSQMSSWLEVNGGMVGDDAMWRSRLLGQCEVLRSMGSSVLRSGFGVGGSRLLFHDGRVWSEIGDIEMRVALQYFCLDDLGVGASEWVRNEKKLLGALRDGGAMSPLRESRAVVGFRNGVYDFSDPSAPVYHPFSDCLDVTSLLPYDYDVSASCPLWQSFLAHALPSSQVELLRRYFGLAMADRGSMPYKVESSLWLVGPGGAGKSTIMNVVRHVIGEDRVSAVSLGALLGGGAENRARFAAAIDGKVFNYCGEVQMEDMTRGADTFKSLCSGEPQMMRRIGCNVEMAREIPYLVFNMNHKPKNRVIDGALRRRLLFVSFPTAVRECDRDPLLEDKLKAEASGIRNWMLEGYRRFLEDGGKISPTEESVNEGDLWMMENGQSVDLFMQRAGYRPYGYTGEAEKGEFISVKTLYDEYFKWCSKKGIEVDVDLAGMGREFKRAGFRSRRMTTGMAYKIYKDNTNAKK